MYTTIAMHPDNRCNKDLRGSLTEFSICGGGNGNDTCQGKQCTPKIKSYTEYKNVYLGDSGGPLFCRTMVGKSQSQQTARYVLTGVTSWGFLCGRTAGAYTKVAKYIDFIKDNGEGF